MKLFKLKENNEITKCIKCGNNTEFNAHSHHCGDDYFDFWIECKCGFDPTYNDKTCRWEDTLDVDHLTLAMMISCWNGAIHDLFFSKEKA